MEQILSKISDGTLFLDAVSSIAKFSSLAYDYFYIVFLKYAFFIMENAITVISIGIPVTIFAYAHYKKMTYQEISVLGLFFALIIFPVSSIVYSLLWANAFFEKYVYYRMLGINYLLDVPRKKRNYVLESQMRERLRNGISDLRD